LKHEQITMAASENRGCDRHLLGLRLASQELDIELPKIFKDESWKKSGGDGNFLISSCCFGYSDTIAGCAPMSQDGYGIFYRITDDGYD
jgi:carnitine O-octanoyltransferase